MRFGTPQLGAHLRAARAIVYCQAAILVMTAVFALGIVVTGGTVGFTLTGMITQTSITGGGVTTFGCVFIAVAIALVAVEQQVARRGGGARVALVAAEVALGVYLIGFVDAAPGGWIFGPAAGAAVLLLHYWPELRSRSAAARGVTPAPAPPEGGRPGGREPDATAPPPL